MSIRGIPSEVYERLRVQAALHRTSMEAEARDLLERGTRTQAGPKGGLGTRIHRLFADVGGFDEFEPPARTEKMREVDFSEWE